MATNIADYVNQVRQDLEGPNPPASIWSDADLQRHVQHAVREYTIWKPQEVLEQGMTLTPGSRNLALAPLPNLIRVLAVEYPVGNWPVTYVQFQVFGGTLTLSLDGAPLGTDPLNVNLYCLERHSVSAIACSIDPADDEAIIAGAVHFAAGEYAFKTAGMVHVAGPNTWLRYRDLALDKAAEFRGYLQIIRGKLTPQRAYAPQEPRQSRFLVEAPWRD